MVIKTRNKKTVDTKIIFLFHDIPKTFLHDNMSVPVHGLTSSFTNDQVNSCSACDIDAISAFKDSHLIPKKIT